MIKRFISRFYNEKVEDISTRILYFFNTLDTYFLVGGVLSFLLYGVSNYSIFLFLAISVLVLLLFKTADFYPLFLIFSPLFLFFLLQSPFLSVSAVGAILLINLGIFLLIQFLFMSIPETIISRDVSIALRKIWNSIFTISPTTVSLPISVYFSSLYSLTLVGRMSVFNTNGLWFWLSMAAASLITSRVRPKSFRSFDIKPQINKKVVERIVLLNIDGCRLDRYYEAGLPFLTSLEKESTYFPQGIETVYRALTNPAFASILTGAVPRDHGIVNNNLGQEIRIEALPDVAKAKLYGSMHIKHFSKPQWDTKIVSLPTESIYKSDQLMFSWLQDDLLSPDGTRLFIADISETDFLGHAYGSESRQYSAALKRADQRIEAFFEWMNRHNLLNNTAVIICSDHGIKRIDHAYLLFNAERYVPFMITGQAIKKNNPLSFRASIMDIAPTISYLLGVRYPANCRGRVFLEALA
jgi:hypothetical protein